MPRLPGIELNPQEAPPVSAASVDPSDLGLTQAAHNLQPVVQALQDRDAAAVGPHLQDLETAWGRQFQQGAAQYRGDQPGWAKEQISAFDDMAQQMTPQGLSWGQRAAWQRGVSSLRAGWGQKAVSTEVEKAGAYVADQQRASDDNATSLGYARYQESFAQSAGEIDKAGGWSLPDYAQRRAEAFDQAAQGALASVPEANRPALQLKIDAERAQVQAETLHARALGEQVGAAQTAQQTINSLANGVRSDPNRTTAALANLPNLAGLPPEEAAKLGSSMRADIVKARVAGLVDQGHTALALSELNGGKWDAYIAPDAKDQLIKDVRTGASQRASQALEAFHWGGSPDLQQALHDAQLAGDEGKAAEVQWRIDVGDAEPGALKSLETGGATGFGHAADFVIDKLEGGAAFVPNDNGKGPTRFGINGQAQRLTPQQVANLTRPEAASIAKRYWIGVNADSLPPDLAFAAFATAFNMGVGPVKAMLAQSGMDTGRFLGLAEQRYRQLAAQPGQEANLPVWLDRLAKVRQEAAAQAAFANVQEGVASDPIKYAMGGDRRAALAPVPALPQDPSDPAWAQALRGRLAVGQMMNGRFHAPLRMLTDGDVAFYKSAIERDPTQGIALAEAATRAVGPANARAMLGELGLHGASAQLHVADLAAAGLTTFPQSAAKGLALGDQVKADPARLKTLQHIFDSRAGLFAGQPDARAAIQAAAEAALKADTASGQVREPDYYFDGAMGGAMLNGKHYGGVARLNGADTVIPPWLGKDSARDALSFLAGGWETNSHAGKAGGANYPVWANGQALTAGEIGRLRLQLMPSGRYRLVDGQGRAMASSHGGAFEFDFDRAAGAIRARFGPAAARGGW